MHQKYENVVRIGLDEVSFVSAQSWKTIRGIGSNSFQRVTNLKAVVQKAIDILGSADRKTHRSFRNLVAPVFLDRFLSTQEPVIVEVAKNGRSTWGAIWHICGYLFSFPMGAD